MSVYFICFGLETTIAVMAESCSSAGLGIQLIANCANGPDEFRAMHATSHRTLRLNMRLTKIINGGAVRLRVLTANRPRNAAC
jgi:hypothetical protein